jgi:outer membrane cobalamin receptor
MAPARFRCTAIALVCTLASASVSCAFHPHANTSVPSSSDDLVITEAMIADLGVRTAWEVVRRKAPMMSYRTNSAGQPTSIWRRGRSSIYVNETALLFVDGVRITDLRALDEIPASQVEEIRIMTGLAGTTVYGTNASSGVILVRTKNAT